MQQIATDIIPSQDIPGIITSLAGKFSLEDIVAGIGSVDYAEFQDDPVGFGEQILGDTYTDDVKTMMESVRDFPVTVAISSNASGKTHAAGRVATWFYKVFEDSQVYTAAAPPEDNLKRLLWGEIGNIQDKFPQLFSTDNQNNLHIARSSNSFLTGVRIPSAGDEKTREGKFSGKHAPHLLFILDEGDAIPDEIYKGIDSCMSGGHARLLVMFNPRQEQGAVYRKIRDGRANVVHLSAMTHPNVITGKDVIPGAVTQAKTLTRINEWCRPLADDEDFTTDCFILPDFLVGKIGFDDKNQAYPPLAPGKYKVVDPQFSYMVLGQYPAQGSRQLISKEWIASARARYDAHIAAFGENPPEGATGIMGLDVAEYGEDSNVACFRYGGYVAPFKRWSGMDPYKTGKRAATEYKEMPNIESARIDGTGIGAGVGPHMQDMECTASTVKVAKSPTFSIDLGDFKILRDQLGWAVREWLRNDPGAMLPPNELLIEELGVLSYEVGNDGYVRLKQKKDLRKLLKRSTDDYDALAVTFAPPGFFDDCDLD